MRCVGANVGKDEYSCVCDGYSLGKLELKGNSHICGHIVGNSTLDNQWDWGAICRCDSITLRSMEGGLKLNRAYEELKRAKRRMS